MRLSYPWMYVEAVYDEDLSKEQFLKTISLKQNHLYFTTNIDSPNKKILCIYVCMYVCTVVGRETIQFRLASSRRSGAAPHRSDHHRGRGAQLLLQLHEPGPAPCGAQLLHTPAHQQLLRIRARWGQGVQG